MTDQPETRYHISLYFAPSGRELNGPVGSCCARGPIHAARRILRAFPEFRHRHILAIHTDPCPVAYYGTDR